MTKIARAQLGLILERPMGAWPRRARLAAMTGLSLATVYRAYVELENRGVVVSQGRNRGSMSGRCFRTFSRCRALGGISQNPSEYRSTCWWTPSWKPWAIPRCFPWAPRSSAELLPLKQLGASLRSVSSAYIKKNGIVIGPPDGTPELKRQIANRLVSYHEKPDMEEIVVTNGCLDAIQLCLRAVAGPE